MARALRSRKAAAGSEFKGAPKKSKKARTQEVQGSAEPEVGQENEHKSPDANHVGDVEGQPSPSVPQGSESKPDQSFFLWETKFQEFLEDTALEEQLLDQLNPWADTRAFLASFEQVAMACRWPRKEWVIRLLPSLNEDAEKAFVSLSPKDRDDFQKVKEAILRQEAAAREKKRQEFRHLHYQEASGPREVHARLWGLCRQWMNVEKMSKEQILEMVVLEQFVNILPKEMQHWVRECFPENCIQAVGLTEKFLKRLQMAEEPEPEENTPVPSKRKEEELVTEKAELEEKKEMDKTADFSHTTIQPGDMLTSMSKKRSTQSAGFEEARLRARFPGRVNPMLPYRWKQGGVTQEQQLSKPLKRGCPLGLVRPLPSPLPNSPPEAALKGKKPCLLQDGSPEDLNRTCSECCITFNGPGSFLRHQMLHSGEKRYACSFCGKGFCFPSELTRHEGRHMGRKPHECAFCGKGFDRKWWRDQHQLQHTKNSPRL